VWAIPSPPWNDYNILQYSIFISTALIGKVVDFITHTIDDGTLYFTVRFRDSGSS